MKAVVTIATLLLAGLPAASALASEPPPAGTVVQPSMLVAYEDEREVREWEIPMWDWTMEEIG